jgi:hypothetical protein
MSQQQSIAPIIFVLAIAALAFYFLPGIIQHQPANPVDAPITRSAPPDMNDSIVISSPLAGEEISSPVAIEGRAKGFWFFEASFPVKLVDANGSLIVQGIANAQGNWMTTDFVPFKTQLKFDAAKHKSGFLIFQKDNPSGLAEYDYSIRIPVTFHLQSPPPVPKQQSEPNQQNVKSLQIDQNQPSQQNQQNQTIMVKVFFNNSRFDPNFSTGRVYPVERVLPWTQAVARAALEELLKGPSDKEKSEDYFTCINREVKINRLLVEDGVARVDFDGQIESQLGGSARVSAIRAQITETLKQFPTVKEVIISVNGRVEDALQP